MPLRQYYTVNARSGEDGGPVRQRVRREVLTRIDPAQLLERRKSDPEGVRRDLVGLTEQAIAALGLHLSEVDVARLRQYVLDEVLGFGPIDGFLSDGSILEVMVNGPSDVWIERRTERGTELVRTDVRFDSDDHVLAVLDRMLREAGRRVDESSPIVDVRLPGTGYRVHAVIPPLCLNGTSLTIRKFTRTYAMDDLVADGVLPAPVADFLAAAVRAEVNILVSGGTGSGKTTFLNALSAFVRDDERIVTIEDTAELRVPKPHVVSLQARPAGVGGGGAVTIRDLVISALRMRPNRIIVGEVRGGEAFDMLQAMNTGHTGSLTTLHANDADDAVRRLEMMALLANVGASQAAIRSQIASAIHVVVQMRRHEDGRRTVTALAEIEGLEGTGADAPVRVRTLAEEDEHHRLRRRAAPGLPAIAAGSRAELVSAFADRQW